MNTSLCLGRYSLIWKSEVSMASTNTNSREPCLLLVPRLNLYERELSVIRDAVWDLYSILIHLLKVILITNHSTVTSK